ncbi:GbsR/MarR family transcriptional regulator [Planctomycetota bacterium]
MARTAGKKEKEQGLEEIFGELTEAFGTFFERFGFKRNFGRVWMTLYLSAEPLDQATLCSRLGLSAGLVSSTLRELEHWTAVRTLTGARGKKLYEPEERLLRTVVSILKKRDAPAVRSILEVVSAALRVLTASRVKGAEGKANRKRVERLRNVQTVGRLYEALVTFVEMLAFRPLTLVDKSVQIISGLVPSSE